MMAYQGFLNFIIDNENNDNLAVSSEHENQGITVLSSDYENKVDHVNSDLGVKQQTQ